MAVQSLKLVSLTSLCLFTVICDAENDTEIVNNSRTEKNETVEDHVEYRIAHFINLYVPPVLVIFGTVCNSLVVLVMQSRHFCSISTSVYMISSTVADTASLTIALPAHWIYVNFPQAIHRSPQSHLMCKFFDFFGWGSSDYGIVLTVAMTVDKSLAILFPLKAQTICTTKRAKWVVFFLLLFIAVKECHFLFVSDIVPPTQTERLCIVDIPNEVYRFFWESMWPLIHNLFLGSSFVVITVSNVVIIVSVVRSERFSKFSGSRKSTQSQEKSKGRQIIIMLLAESFILILLTLPFSLQETIAVNFTSDTSTTRQVAINQLVFSVVFYLLYINRCLSFCLYCITGSRFRKALLEILTCKKKLREKVSPFQVTKLNANTI